MASFKLVVQSLTLLKELFPNWEQTDSTQRLWMIALHDMSDADLELALAAYIHGFTTEFAPKQPVPGDLRKHLQKAVISNTETTWSQAFAECIEKSIHVISPVYCTLPDGSFGPKPVQFSSPLVEKAFDRFGGARAFIGIEDSDTTAAAQFRDIYHATRDKMIAQKQSIAELPAPPVRPALEAPRKQKELTPSQAEKSKKIMDWLQKRFETPGQAIPAVAKMLAQRDIFGGGTNV